MNGDAGDLVMESTTDTEAQIREGLGLPPVDAGSEDAPDPHPVDGTDGDGVDPGDPPAGPDAPGTEEAPAPAVQPRTTAGTVTSPKPKATAEQKKIDRVAAAARREAEAENAVLRAEIKAIRERMDQVVAPPVSRGPATDQATIDPRVTATFDARRTALGPKPKQTDYPDFDVFEEKRDEWVAEQGALRAEERIAQSASAKATEIATTDARHAFQSLVTSYETGRQTAKARHADYDAVATTADQANLVAQPHVRRAILEAEDTSGELGYQIMKDPALLARLNALPAGKAALEIGRLLGTYTTKAAPATRPALSTKPVSRAPAPTGTELGGLPSATTDDLEAATSQADYNRMRDRQAQARGRRR